MLIVAAKSALLRKQAMSKAATARQEDSNVLAWLSRTKERSCSPDHIQRPTSVPKQRSILLPEWADRHAPLISNNHSAALRPSKHHKRAYSDGSSIIDIAGDAHATMHRDQGFERRPRRRTRPDKYETKKQVRRNGSNRGEVNAKGETASVPQKQSNAMYSNFKRNAEACTPSSVLTERVLLPRHLGPGVFSNSRKSTSSHLHDLTFPDPGKMKALKVLGSKSGHSKRLERERAEVSSFFPAQSDVGLDQDLITHKNLETCSSSTRAASPRNETLRPRDENNTHERISMTTADLALFDGAATTQKKDQETSASEATLTSLLRPQKPPALTRGARRRDLYSQHQPEDEDSSELLGKYRESLLETRVFRNTGIDPSDCSITQPPNSTCSQEIFHKDHLENTGSDRGGNPKLHRTERPTSEAVTMTVPASVSALCHEELSKEQSPDTRLEMDTAHTPQNSAKHILGHKTLRSYQSGPHALHPNQNQIVPSINLLKSPAISQAALYPKHATYKVPLGEDPRMRTNATSCPPAITGPHEGQLIASDSPFRFRLHHSASPMMYPHTFEPDQIDTKRCWTESPANSRKVPHFYSSTERAAQINLVIEDPSVLKAVWGDHTNMEPVFDDKTQHAQMTQPQGSAEVLTQHINMLPQASSHECPTIMGDDQWFWDRDPDKLSCDLGTPELCDNMNDHYDLDMLEEPRHAIELGGMNSLAEGEWPPMDYEDEIQDMLSFWRPNGFIAM
ncbi:hypothetical protein MN608_04899 [Microdochium nivale]|nr:hypothetical protein MN608_04899 [Microdochium nivale]